MTEPADAYNFKLTICGPQAETEYPEMWMFTTDNTQEDVVEILIYLAQTIHNLPDEYLLHSLYLSDSGETCTYTVIMTHARPGAVDQLRAEIRDRLNKEKN